eukprot:scaffold50547_cov33-Tisochrysis_lutea.AAC.4
MAIWRHLALNCGGSKPSFVPGGAPPCLAWAGTRTARSPHHRSDAARCAAACLLCRAARPRRSPTS